MKKLLITIILLSASIVHAQTDEKETLKQINQNAISAYQNQKFDDAIKFGQQAIDLSLKIFGAKSLETANAYSNLGIIYLDKKKFKESIENLQKAVEIYESVSNFKNTVQLKTYETPALSQFLGGKDKEAEITYLKAIEVAGEKFGKESKEVFEPSLNLGKFYARSKKFDKADDYYLKSYALAVKNFGREAKQLTEIGDTRICLLGGYINHEGDKIYDKAINKILGEDTDKEEKSSINGGIINGKAKSLPKPVYPFEAKSQGLSGTISVRVTIDEQGNVTEARSVCGNPILGKASEEAARNAKFSPTRLDGKSVSVTGIIVYRFVH